MGNDSPPLTDDPEILALLDFEPVARKCERRDGWTAERQRAFIAGLAETGDKDFAANAVGKTSRGAYDLRKAAGAEPFIAAWDAALALHARRAGRPAPAGPRPTPPADEAPDEERLWDVVEDILVKYMMKLGRERQCRLEGRIVEADFYVRQLTWLEVALDLGGKAPELLKRLRRGDRHAGEIAATPMSLLLGNVRRAVWARMGEPERPAPPPLGEHDGEISLGPPWWHSKERDGPEKEWRRRQSEEEKLAAEAQAAWEEKARKDAAEWRARVEGAASAGSAESAAAPAMDPRP